MLPVPGVDDFSPEVGTWDGGLLNTETLNICGCQEERMLIIPIPCARSGYQLTLLVGHLSRIPDDISASITRSLEQKCKVA